MERVRVHDIVEKKYPKGGEMREQAQGTTDEALREVYRAAARVLQAKAGVFENKAAAALITGMAGEEAQHAPREASRPNVAGEVKEVVSTVATVMAEMNKIIQANKPDAETTKALNELRERLERLIEKTTGGSGKSEQASPQDTLGAMQQVLDMVKLLNNWVREQASTLAAQGGTGVGLAVPPEQSLQSLQLQKDMLELRLRHDQTLTELRNQNERVLAELKHQHRMSELAARQRIADTMASMQKQKEFWATIQEAAEGIGLVLEEDDDEGPQGQPEAGRPVLIDCEECGAKRSVVLIPGVHKEGDKVACGKCKAVHEAYFQR